MARCAKISRHVSTVLPMRAHFGGLHAREIWEFLLAPAYVMWRQSSVSKSTYSLLAGARNEGVKESTARTHYSLVSWLVEE